MPTQSLRPTPASDAPHAVTLIPGDGVGPHLVEVTRRLVEATGVRIDWQERQAGGRVFAAGLATGLPEETIASILSTGVVLKGPLATPVGHGEKSANVTLRKLFETYANVRPVREVHGVQTPFSGRGVDLVIVRENVEDLYAGIEHMQTPGVAQCLKLMSRRGCEKIVRFAFELALAEGRSRVHCATKANIMKLTEGLLKRTFEEIAVDYPQIAAEHIIIDNCAHELVRFPEKFQVIVTSNMNGDILSDLASGLVGGLGFAPSANIGDHVAIFEAVHGSAPTLAGQDVANPTALVLSAAMMLRHLGELDAATRLKNALLSTLESGIRTRDVDPVAAVSTTDFATAVEGNLGKLPRWAPARTHVRAMRPPQTVPTSSVSVRERRDVGVDIFIESTSTALELGQQLERIARESPLRLKMISNRGTVVYPPSDALVECVDHWRCRFMSREVGAAVDEASMLSLIARVGATYRWMHIEKLTEFDGAAGFTRAQGEA